MSTLTATRPEIRSIPPSTRARPSRAGYWIAGFVALIGATASIGWGATRAWDAYKRVDGFARHAIPGEVTVMVTDPGTQIIYYEGSRRPAWSDLGLTVRGPSGDAVTVEAYDLDLRYDYQGVVAKAIAVFEAPAPGRYVASASIAPERDAGLAVGEDLTSIGPIVLLAVSSLLISLLLGAAIAGMTYDRRSNS